MHSAPKAALPRVRARAVRGMGRASISTAQDMATAMGMPRVRLVPSMRSLQAGGRPVICCTRPSESTSLVTQVPM